MGTDKRARQKELGRTRAEQARKEAEVAARRRRLTRLSAVIIVLVGVTVLSLYLASDDSSSGADGPTSSTTVSPSATSTSDPSKQPAVLKGPAPGATITGDTPCPKADGSSPRTSKFAKAPSMCIDTKKTYVAKISTTKGDLAVTLDATKAPKTVNNFVVLSQYHFYDGIPFHRIIADFMIQGGDPSDPPTGSGGPGYEFADELPKAGDYQVGSIAMANSGKDTDGSQFFIITGAQGVSLPPSYSLFGKVTTGLDVLDVLGKTPNLGGQAGTPLEAVTIKSITITES